MAGSESGRDVVGNHVFRGAIAPRTVDRKVIAANDEAHRRDGAGEAEAANARSHFATLWTPSSNLGAYIGMSVPFFRRSIQTSKPRWYQDRASRHSDMRRGAEAVLRSA